MFDDRHRKGELFDHFPLDGLLKRFVGLDVTAGKAEKPRGANQLRSADDQVTIALQTDTDDAVADALCSAPPCGTISLRIIHCPGKLSFRVPGS